MKNSLETKLGIFVLFAVFAAWAIIETLGSASLFGRGYRVSALFNTVQDLKVGDRVKMEMSQYDLNKARIVWRLG